jgi:hypothetical protein
MERTRATTVVKAAVRLKMLAIRCRQKREHPERYPVEGDPENGFADGASMCSVDMRSLTLTVTY